MNDFISSMQLCVGLPALTWDLHPAAPAPTSYLGQSCLLNCSAITWEFGPVFWLGFTIILHATIDECLSCHPALCFDSLFSSHQHICGKYFFMQKTPASNKDYYSLPCAVMVLWLGFGQVLCSALSARLKVFWRAFGQQKHIMSVFPTGTSSLHLEILPGACSALP